MLNKCGRISTHIIIYMTKDAANDLITAKHYSGMGRIALVRIVFATFSCFRVLGALLKFKFSKKTYLIVIKDETGLKFKMNDSTLFLIGSYAQTLVASY